jgi:hypothetical protein
LQCLKTTWANASFTNSHPINCSIQGYTFNRFWIERVYDSIIVYSLDGKNSW